MKKSVKPTIVFSLFVLVVTGFVIVGYVSLKLECEQLAKQKVLAEEELVTVNNKQVNLFAEVQYLMSEERIVPIAESELQMVGRTAQVISITIDKSKVEDLENFLLEKYE
ncbi:MAG: hypothetical protein IPM56_11715 [Ignavibacteriales bacterium]|nr:MAG: hypothetical protein IPM56_11715 [Ignavibacteriales bacterium]